MREEPLQRTEPHAGAPSPGKKLCFSPLRRGSQNFHELSNEAGENVNRPVSLLKKDGSQSEGQRARNLKEPWGKQEQTIHVQRSTMEHYRAVQKDKEDYMN